MVPGILPSSPLFLLYFSSLCSFYIASFLCARLRYSQNLEREANLFDQGNGRISSEVFVVICKKRQTQSVISVDMEVARQRPMLLVD